HLATHPRYWKQTTTARIQRTASQTSPPWPPSVLELRGKSIQARWSEGINLPFSPDRFLASLLA
ncbi:hypothetical protein FRC03_000648, partial [Tulasnella sp. 419]